MIRTARAWRYPVETTIQYRLAAAADWLDGRTINVSPTGVLFSTVGDAPAPGAVVELVLELSSIGSLVADVSCQARIVRTLPASEGAAIVGAAIERYRFSPRS